MRRHFKRAVLVAVGSFALVNVAAAEHAEREGIPPGQQQLLINAPSTSQPPCIPAYAANPHYYAGHTICQANGQPVIGSTPHPPRPLPR
jgi:hypothetical protein